ncbi:MAG: fibronectin type III domain-containing protein [candidate division NC10 bacterium]|nr:fibronectin type III domain-containing protein [candidate division NC10 bacterium]
MSSFWSLFEGPFLVFLLLLILPVIARPEEAAAAQLTLTWTDNSTNEAGFNIERRTGQTGAFALINAVGADVESYTDSSLADGTEYCYRVQAFNGVGNSAYSNVDCGTATIGGGGGGGGCFIATAAFGSPLAAEVQLLREFRNRALLTHAPGRVLVAAYYRLSPLLAEQIRQDEALRAVTRGLLWPVVWWAHLALVSPALALALGGGPLVAGPLIALLLRRARRARAARRIQP